MIFVDSDGEHKKKCQESTSPEFTMLVNDRFDFFVINDLISNAIKIDSGFVHF